MEDDTKPRRGHAASRRTVLSGVPDAGARVEGDVARAKSAVAAAITATLARRGLTMRAAAVELRLDAADVQRIRSGELGRFTLDRLVRVASRSGHRVELRLLPPAMPGAGA